jgi:hypothetical protein
VESKSLDQYKTEKRALALLFGMQPTMAEQLPHCAPFILDSGRHRRTARQCRKSIAATGARNDEISD